MEHSTSQTLDPVSSTSHTPIQPQQTEPSTTHSSAAEYELLRINPETLGEVWGDVGELMHDVVNAEYTGLTMERLLEDVRTGETELWAIARDKVVALGGTEFKQTPRGERWLEIKFLVGTEMNRWKHVLQSLEDYARHNECIWLETIARKGWAKKLPDYKITSIILRKEL